MFGQKFRIWTKTADFAPVSSNIIKRGRTCESSSSFVNSSGNKQNADYTRALPGQQKYYSLAPLLRQRFANRSFFSLSLVKPARFSSVELFSFIDIFLQIRVHQDLLANFLQHQISIRQLLFCNKSKLRILSTFTSATTVLQHNSWVPSLMENDYLPS